MDITLTEEQEQAIDALLCPPPDTRDLSLAGPAGSGKTTILRAIRDGYDCEKDNEVEVCTPTNKAAQVLRSKGVEANTIYKKFFVPEIVENTDARGRVISRWLKFTAACDYAGVLPDGKRRHAPYVIVDEASMLPTWVVAKLRRMCDRLILVGDPHQLPPVKDKLNPGGHFNTLRHDAVLNEIHRQKEGSDILGLATAIRTESPKAVSYINSFRPSISFEQACEEGYQMIAFTNKERARINAIYRSRLGFNGVLPQPGDRMISLDNFNDEVLNGTTFVCRQFDWDQTVGDDGLYVHRFGRITADLDSGVVRDMVVDVEAFLRDQLVSQTKGFARFHDRKEDDPSGLSMTYGYCMTAHKAQGSEYGKVAVIDQRNVIRMMTESAIARGEVSLSGDEMARRWLYTAVTRAQHELVVAGQWWAVLDVEQEMAA